MTPSTDQVRSSPSKKIPLNRYLKLIVALSLTCIFGYSKAQTYWSLEDCIRYAHENNIQVKRRVLAAEIAQNDYMQSRIYIAPDINAGIYREYKYGRSIDPFTNTFTEDNTTNDNLGIMANLDVFNGLQKYNAIQMRKYLLLSAREDIEQEKLNITLNIASAYLDILFKEELVKARTRQMELTELQVDRTQKLVEVGSVASGSLLEIKAQHANEKLNLIDAQNSLDLAYLNLSQLLDLDTVGNLKIVVPDSIEVDMNTPLITTDSIYQESLLNQPQIKRAGYQLNYLQKDLALQQGKVSPRFYLRGTWGTGYSSYLEDEFDQSYSDQLDGNSNTTLTLGVSIPIFNQWQVVNSISNARIRVFDAEYALEQAEQNIYKVLQQAKTDAVSAREKYFSAGEAVSSYQESFKYTEQKYSVGMINAVEYNMAKNYYIQAESDLLQAKYQFIFALKILDIYRGIPIVL